MESQNRAVLCWTFWAPSSMLICLRALVRLTTLPACRKKKALSVHGNSSRIFHSDVLKLPPKGKFRGEAHGSTMKHPHKSFATFQVHVGRDPKPAASGISREAKMSKPADIVTGRGRGWNYSHEFARVCWRWCHAKTPQIGGCPNCCAREHQRDIKFRGPIPICGHEIGSQDKVSSVLVGFRQTFCIAPNRKMANLCANIGWHFFSPLRPRSKVVGATLPLACTPDPPIKSGGKGEGVGV